jgi:hypothetical protein
MGKLYTSLENLLFWRVCKRATWTGIAHTLNVGVHSRPVIMQTIMVEFLVGIEMSADCIGVKCHKDDVIKFCSNKLRAGA